MRRFAVLALFVVTTSVFMGGCASEAQEDTSASEGAIQGSGGAEDADAPVVVRTSGSKVVAKEGQKVVVRLEESDGSEWVPGEEDRTLGAPEKTIDAPKKKGGSSVAVFAWDTTPSFGSTAGTYSLQLDLQKGGKTVDSFKFTLDVRAAD